MEVVSRMGADNAELGQFLCMGDRMAIRELCTRHRSSKLESAIDKRKHNCKESIQRGIKTMDPSSSGESEEEKVATKSTKLGGNKNASKPERAIEFS